MRLHIADCIGSHTTMSQSLATLPPVGYGTPLARLKKSGSVNSFNPKMSLPFTRAHTLRASQQLLLLPLLLLPHLLQRLLQPPLQLDASLGWARALMPKRK